MKDLVIVNKITEELGIPLTDAEKIVASFSEVAVSISELDKELVEFNKHTEITKEVCQQAREIRLKLVKVRTKGDEIHQELKSSLLLRTRAIDGVRNIYKLKISENETKLKDIELHFEKLEQAKKDKINAERELELSKYVIDVTMYNFKEMSDEVFASLVTSVKKIWEAEQEVIAQKEADRLKKEEDDKIEQERIRQENEQLKAEAEVREKELEKERAEQKKKLEAEQLKSKKEAEARQKIEDELQAKKDAEEKLKKDNELKEAKEKADKLEAEKQAQLAPDKDKLKKYAVELGCLEVPQLQSDEAKKTLAQAINLINQAITLLKTK